MKRIGTPGGASVLLHTCEVCGADASFGVGVQLKPALIKLAAGDIAAAKRHLGKWYCGEHKDIGNESDVR